MSMGFCFYNNAGIAARAAQAAGARRVLILDWDVHHGNGAPPCIGGCNHRALVAATTECMGIGRGGMQYQRLL